MVYALLIVLAFAPQAVSCGGAPRISQEDLKKLRASGNVVVVDTRNEEAYRRGHIPGAVLLPLEGLPIWPEEYNKTVEKLKAARYSANVGRLRETLEFLNSAAEETRQARKALFLIDATPKAKQDLKPYLTFYTQAGRRKPSKEIHGEK